MTVQPTGVVTFVFTDIEGSTRLLEHLGDDTYAALLEQHHRVLREAITSNGGVVRSTQGDSFFAVFAEAGQALEMALAAQRGLAAGSWPGGALPRVRIGIHTGDGRPSGDSYIGLAVHQAARVSAAGHGGQVVVSRATYDAARLPPGARWLELGRHRLKDLGAAVELFQLAHDQLESQFPPLRSLERVAHNLPIQPSTFLGRGDELALGGKLLTATRLLTVTGPGGTGKTRLAYQLAAEQVQEFPDGVWVAELSSLAAAEQVPAALMGSLGLRSEPGRSAEETVTAHLRDRTALLVLDNCEHLLAAAAQLVGQVILGCPRVRVLVTTREPLHLAGETVWPLQPLSVPDLREQRLEVLAQVDAVALFCERAAEAKVGFALTPENAAVVTRICSRLDGIPLAIELAAARVRSLPLTELASLLERSLDLLSQRRHGAPERQSSLRGAIAWSHDLLSLSEQVLFRRLAVFAGGCTLPAAEAVCAGQDEPGSVPEILADLVDRSLVVLDEDEAGGGRFRLLETIRAYASEHLDEQGERAAVADRHAVFCTDLAASAQRSDDWGVLVVEHANVLAALDHLAHSGEPLRHGELVNLLVWFWNRRGHWDLGRRELLRYLDRSDRDPRLVAVLEHGVGDLAFNLEDYEEAGSHYRAALADARGRGDRRLEARSLHSLGNVAGALEDYPGAATWFEPALVIARELGDRRLEGACVRNLGNIAASLGRPEEAQTHFSAALEIARELKSRHAEAAALANLGTAALLLDDLRTARDRTCEALEHARVLEDRALEGRLLRLLGTVALRLDEPDQATQHFRAALTIARDLGQRSRVVDSLRALALLALGAGDVQQAQRHLTEACALAAESPEPDTELLDVAAQLLVSRGDHAEAARVLAAAEASGRTRDAAGEARFHEAREACRAQLSAEAFADSWKSGGELSWPAALELASSCVARVSPTPR